MAEHVCPWWMGYLLASPMRRWMQDPRSIIAPFVHEGMTVLEPGPGMGFFTLELARRVGPNGRVIAVDIEPRMLDRLMRRARKARVADRIDARRPRGERLGIEDYQGKVDFALVFAMVHEVPRQDLLFADLAAALGRNARLLLAEPAGHVSAGAFDATLALAAEAGFALESRPSIRRSRSAVMVRT